MSAATIETVKTYTDGLRIDRVIVPTWSDGRNCMENLTHFAMFGPDGKPVRAGLFPNQLAAEEHAEWLQRQGERRDDR